MQAGDRLSFNMMQTVPTDGGLALIFTTADSSGDPGSGSLTDSATGTPLYFNATAPGQWQALSGDLTPYAGRTISYVLAGIHASTPTGQFDLYLADAAIQTSDGRTLPILTGQSASVANFSPSNWTGQPLNSATETIPVTDAKVSTNYYLDDHLGTAQMELSGGGWPLWQGQFTPFGQEIVNGLTNNVISPQTPDGTAMRYKFTGKERDTESGLDYFGARYYASNMGRWMSPDWASNPQAVPYATYANPQSLNLYNYMRNNPLGGADPDGHCDWCKAVGRVAGSVGMGLAKTLVNTINFIGGDCSCQAAVQRNTPTYGPSNGVEKATMITAAIASVAAPVVDAAFGGSATVTATAPAALETESAPATTTLFRAVDSTEMESIQSTGQFSASPNGTEYKGFFNTAEGAQQFGAQQSAMGGPSTSVVSGTAPTDLVNGSPVHSAATEGPGVLIHNDNLPLVKPQVPPQ